MDNYFEQELKRLEQELQWLKTSFTKSSSIVETVSRTIEVSLPLSMNTAQTSCSGKKQYTISCDSNSILDISLDWYYGNVADNWKIARTTRAIWLDKVMLDDGRIGVEIQCYGTNYSDDQSDDLSKLKNGQSVIITANLTVRATDNFTLGEY